MILFSDEFEIAVTNPRVHVQYARAETALLLRKKARG